MTDNASTNTQQQAVQKDNSSPAPGQGRPGGGRGGKRQHVPRPGSAQSGSTKGDNQRPSSRTSKKGDAGGPKAEGTTESNAKRTTERGKGAHGGGRGGKKNIGNGQNGRQGPAGSNPQQGSVKPTGQSDETDAALQNLQRMITDLKSISPPNSMSPQQQNAPNSLSSMASNSTLPPNAPVFQPGAAAYPGTNALEASLPPPRHRKAASLGAPPVPMTSSYSSYSSNLGSMMEDEGAYEDGEIPEPPSFQPAHQPRAQSQSFTAPRFQALAEQERNEILGPSGRPQLAPTFTFGARRRGGTNPVSIAPAISEEDANFQFPQQHQQEAFQPSAPQEHHRRTNSGAEISGIMAEQVCSPQYRND